MLITGRVPLRGVVPEATMCAVPGDERSETTLQPEGKLAPLALDAVRTREFHFTTTSRDVIPSAGAALTGTFTVVPLPPAASSGMLIVDWAVTMWTWPFD